MEYKVVVTFGHWWNYDGQNHHLHFGPCTEEEGKVFCTALQDQLHGLTPAKNKGFEDRPGAYEHKVREIFMRFLHQIKSDLLHYPSCLDVWSIKCRVVSVCDLNLAEATTLLKNNE